MNEEFEARFRVETNQAITSLAKLRQEAEGLGPAYTKVAQSLGQAESKLSGLTNSTNAQTAAAKRAESATRGWATSVSSAFKAQTQGTQKNVYDDYLSSQKAGLTELRRVQDNYYNDYLAHQKESAAVARQATAAEEARIAGLSRTRYALYDVSNAAAIAGAALVAGFVLPANAAIQFEKAFAQVERTTGVTGAAAQQLKQDFIDLSTSIPVSFGELTQIGAIAGQLGIAASGVDDFTSVIARFSATTDLSIDKAATSIGRLTQLLPDAKGRYEDVASAILEVGVNSVASESQITAIATQLSGIAASAKLTTPDLIALSGALASVGTAPELSRGLVTRLFTNIQIAVANGGQQLEDFGRLSGKTGAQFEADWGNNKGTAILDLLNGINRQGDGATSALNALGIASVRDIPALQRLAANTSIYSDALEQANSQFDQGTALAAQYGIIASTTAARLDVLGNSFQALLAAIGESTTGFPDLLQFVTDLIKGFTAVVKNPVGSTIAAIGLAMVALAGATALAAAAITRGAATMIAFQQAALATGASAGVATAGITALKVAMIGTGIGAIIVTLGTIAATVLQMSGAFDDAKKSAESYFGTIDPIVQGLVSDQQAGVDAIRQISTAYEDSSSSAQSWVGSVEDATGAQVALGQGTEKTTDQIRNQSIAYGENAKAALAAALANSDAFQELFKNNSFETLAPFGGSAEGFVSAILGDPVAGGQAYAQKLQTSIQQQLQASNLDISGLIVASQEASGQGLQKYADALGITTAEARTLVETITQLRDASTASGEAVTSAASQVQAFDAVSKATGQSVEELAGMNGDLGASSETLASQLQGLIDPIFEGINAQYALQDATSSLGEAFVNQGADVAFSGQAMQQAISAILQSAGSAPQAAGMLQGLFDAIVAGGYASAQQLQYLQASIASLAGGKAVKAIPFDFSPFVAGAGKATQALQKTGGAAGGAAKQVRTLVDYANDLGKVFDRSFDLRFGNQQAFDQISTKFNDVAKANQAAVEAMEDYRQQIQETQASIAGLSADKRIQEYFLSVANAYGDTLRAQKITANLADINAQLADKQTDLTRTNKKLTDAQAKQTKSTQGNSQAAIDNRSELLDLVGSYQDYVKQLASSGLSQDELKVRVQQLQQDFIRQATQLGYNQEEVMGYAASFDDLAVAINGVPRNITVTADASPAIQALNEFVAQAQAIAANGGVNIPITTSSDNSGQRKALADSIGAYQAQLDALYATTGGNSNVNTGRLEQAIRRLKDQLNSMGGYASGGFVPGPTPGNRNIDNAIGMLPGGGMVGLQGGEPIINNSARRFYGDAMFNAINHLQYPRGGFATGGFIPSGGGAAARSTTSGSTGPQVVILDAAQFQALVNSGQVNVQIGSKAVAGAVSGVNQQYADLGVGN